MKKTLKRILIVVALIAMVTVPADWLYPGRNGFVQSLQGGRQF